MEIINHECYVPLEVTKLLKEVGFNWEVKTYYHYLSPYDEYNLEFDSISTNYNHLNNADFSAPSLDVAQRWLREVKNIDVYIFPTTNIKRECVYQVGIKTFGRTLWIYGQPSTIEYVAYEEAQEAGIKKALELILEKGE